MSNPPELRIGYLISEYPAISHSFILREIAALRERGFVIDVSSINQADNLVNMPEVEQIEAAKTFYVKRAGAIGALKSLTWLACRHPKGLLAGLFTAFKLGGMDLIRVTYRLLYLAEAAIVARWLHERALSHLHVHFATPAATVALLVTKIAPVTISLTVHGPDEFYDVAGYHLREKIAAAQFVVCISFFARSQLMKLAAPSDWNKLEIARLGVDSHHFSPRPFLGSPKTLEILCVGRLVAAKGQRILIHVMEQLVQQGRSVRLRLIGDGPDRTGLMRLVNERHLYEYVLFEGSIAQDRIRAFYQEADIFALASFAEGIPVVLMEAMAMEIPCVATSVNGIPELIRDGVDGLIVAPADIAGLTSAITCLMDAPLLRESLGKAGRRRVQESYDLSRNVDKLAEIFQHRLEATISNPLALSRSRQVD